MQTILIIWLLAGAVCSGYMPQKENTELKFRLNQLETQVSQIALNTQVDCYSDIILEQNQPNPFDNTTTINYYVTSKYQGLIEFIVADAQGISIMNTQVATLDKPVSIMISSNNYDSGIYLYGIRINGKIVKSKKMIIIK